MGKLLTTTHWVIAAITWSFVFLFWFAPPESGISVQRAAFMSLVFLFVVRDDWKAEMAKDAAYSKAYQAAKLISLDIALALFCILDPVYPSYVVLTAAPAVIAVAVWFVLDHTVRK